MAGRYGLQVRAPTSADAADLADLLTAAGHPIGSAAMAARLEAIRHDRGSALIALAWGPPSGLVVVHWFQTLNDDRPVAEISLLLVNRDERRRGIGRLLLKSASQSARAAGCGTLRMALPGPEPSLAAFCRAAGFDEAGTTVTRPLRKASPARDEEP